MRKFRVTAAIAGVMALGMAVASLGCSSSKSNPLDSAKSMVNSHTGPNTALSATNADSAVAAVSDLMQAGYSQAFSSLFTSLGAKTSRKASYSLTLESATYNGSNSGTITLKSGSVNVTTDANNAPTSATMNANLQFNDYSNDGVLFVGGTVTTTVTITFTSATLSGFSAGYQSNIALSGLYSGAMSTDLTVSVAGATTGHITGTVTINGQSTTIDETIPFTLPTTGG